MSLLRLRAGPRVGFHPLDIGQDLLAFWDGRYGVTSSGGSVSSWKDAFGFDCVQATEANKPTLSGAWLYGDGLSKELTGAPVPSRIPVDAVASWAWYVVDQRTPATSTTETVLGGWGGSATSNARRLTRPVVGGVNRAGFRCGGTLARNDFVDFSSKRTVVLKASGTMAQVDVDGIPGTPAAVVPSTGALRLRFFASTLTGANTWSDCGFTAAFVTPPVNAATEARLLAWCNERRAA